MGPIPFEGDTESACVLQLTCASSRLSERSECTFAVSRAIERTEQIRLTAAFQLMLQSPFDPTQLLWHRRDSSI
jgi:hypothetical protein